MEQFLQQLIDVIVAYLYGDIAFNHIADNIKLAAKNSAMYLSDEECLNIRNYIGQKLQEYATNKLKESQNENKNP